MVKWEGNIRERKKGKLALHGLDPKMSQYDIRNLIPTRFWSVIIVGAVALLMVSIVWTFFSLVVESVAASIEAAVGISSGAQNSVTYIHVFLLALPILATIGIIVWGYKTVVRQRELRGPYNL